MNDAQNIGQDLALVAGTRLGFTVLPGRWCLGHQLITDRTHRTLVPCPHQALITTGTQCAECEGADQSRAMHDFHRSDRASAGLRDYLNQPHWLYVATFAQGTTKVGTAAGPSKWRRLAEQGAIVARYVAWSPEGASIRRLEDRVSAELGITQQVRANSKARGLVENHLSTADLDALNAAVATRVRTQLGTGAMGSSHGVDENWIAPEQHTFLRAGFDAKTLHPYPAQLHSGDHGFTLRAICGAVQGVHIDGQPELFVANAAVLKGRKLSLGEHVTKAPPVQSALF